MSVEDVFQKQINELQALKDSLTKDITINEQTINNYLKKLTEYVNKVKEINTKENVALIDKVKEIKKLKCPNIVDECFNYDLIFLKLCEKNIKLTRKQIKEMMKKTLQ